MPVAQSPPHTSAAQLPPTHTGANLLVQSAFVPHCAGGAGGCGGCGPGAGPDCDDELADEFIEIAIIITTTTRVAIKNCEVADGIRNCYAAGNGPGVVNREVCSVPKISNRTTAQPNNV